MAEYIEREALLQEIQMQKDASRTSYPKQHFVVGDVLTCIYLAPAADVAPVVRCKDCIYWKDRHIKLNDGTERPYTEEELHQFCGMVPLSIGINVSSYCTRFKLEDTNFWCGPDDFCSKGARMEGKEVTDEVQK